MNAGGRPTEVRTDVDPWFAIVDTTELRWFVPGPVPAEVRNWFIGSTGVVEVRRDSYLVHDRVDIGMKRRGQTTLELKVRQAVEPWADLGDGLAGPLEWWRKWTPAQNLVEIPTSGLMDRRRQVDHQATILAERHRGCLHHRPGSRPRVRRRGRIGLGRRNRCVDPCLRRIRAAAGPRARTSSRRGAPSEHRRTRPGSPSPSDRRPATRNRSPAASPHRTRASPFETTMTTENDGEHHTVPSDPCVGTVIPARLVARGPGRRTRGRRPGRAEVTRLRRDRRRTDPARV